MTPTHPTPDAPPAPSRRSLPRRLLRIAGWTFGTLLLLVALTVLFFHTPPGKDIARGLIESAISKKYNAKIELDAVDYALFGDIELTGLRIIAPDATTPTVHLHHLTLTPRWSSLTSGHPVLETLTIAGLDLNLIAYADGSNSLKRLQKEPPKLPAALTIESLSLTHINLHLTQPDGTRVDLSDLQLAGSLSLDRRAQDATATLTSLATTFALTRPDALTLTLPLAATAALTAAPDALTFTLTPAPTTATLTLPDRPPAALPLALGPITAAITPSTHRATLALADLTAGPLTLASLTVDLPLPPPNKVALTDAPHTFTLTGLHLDAATANALLHQPLLASDLTAAVRVTGSPATLALAGQVTTQGGDLVLSGTADLADLTSPTAHLVLTSPGLDTTRLLASPTRPDVQTAFDLTIDLRGLPPAHDATVRLNLGPTTVAGRTLDALSVVAEASGSKLTLSEATLAAFGQKINLNGTFDQDTRTFDADLRLNTALGPALQSARDAGALTAPLPAITGTIALDLHASGRLKPTADLPPPLTSPAALLQDGRLTLAALPLATATLKGTLQAKDVTLADRRLGHLNTAIDLALPADNPEPHGTLTVRLADLQAAPLTLDAFDLDLTLEGLTQRLTAALRDSKTHTSLKLAADSSLDPTRQRADLTLSTLDLQRGPTVLRLLAPSTFTFHGATPSESLPRGPQTVTIPPVKLALAGGTVTLAATAAFSGDPARPGATQLDQLSLDLDLDRLDVAALARLAQKRLPGLNARLSGTARASGSPAAPELDASLRLTGRSPHAAPWSADTSITLRKQRLELSGKVHDSQNSPNKFLNFAASLPLTLPKAPGGRPGLAPNAPLHASLDLPEVPLSRLLALTPRPPPASLDPNATIAITFDLSGTQATPTADWDLTLAGRLLPQATPPSQRLAIRGALRSGASYSDIVNNIHLFLSPTPTPTLEHITTAHLARSPLLPNPLSRPWNLVAKFAEPLDLSALYTHGLVPAPLAGAVALTASLNGDRDDLLGALTLDVNDVHGPKTPPLHGQLALTLREAATTLAGALALGAPCSSAAQPSHEDPASTPPRTTACGAHALDVLTVDLTTPLAGRGLRPALRHPARLAALPLSGTLTVPDHPLSAFRALFPALPALPGTFGGALALAGTLKTPTVKGALTWDDFTTAANTPGEVALLLDVTPQALSATLTATPEHSVFTQFSLPRAALGAPTAPLPIQAQIRAQAVALTRLIPASASPSSAPPLQGRLDADLQGTLNLSRATPGLAPGSQLLGTLTLTDLDLRLPDGPRHLRDGSLALRATPDALTLDHLRFFEDDPQTTNRSIELSGKVALTQLTPTDATLRVQADRWLALGLDFQRPEATLTLDATLTAQALQAPVKQVALTIASLNLDSPERFIRAHYPQFPAYGDILYTDADHPQGRLPPGKPPLIPPAIAAAPPPAPADTTTPGADVHIAIPNPIRVTAGNIPIELFLQGTLDAVLRGSSLAVHAAIDAVSGKVGAMGRDFILQHGAITADGPASTLRAELAFATQPSDIALRDVATAHHTPEATLTVLFTPQTGQRVVFGGVSGPFLLDMATFLNTGRARLWGLPDVPASETVRFGNLDQGLVLSFIQTNLRNMIFMDRANGWSESLEAPADYGKLQHFDMQRFVGDSRISFTSQPVTIGQNRMELSYDWLLHKSPRTVLGLGPHLGLDLKVGVGLTFDWASEN